MAKTGWDKWREKKARQNKRALKKAIRKTNTAYIIIMIAALALGFFTAYLGLDTICKNDSFELNGEQIITFTVGQPISYTDEGISYVSLGRDLSSKIKTECTLQVENGAFSAESLAIGNYPIIYTAVGGRCDGQTLYRIIRIVETEG